VPTLVAVILMDGIRLRDEIVERLRKEVEAAGSPPICLATVLVGDDAPSQRYVRSKHVQAQRAGLQSRNETLAADAAQTAAG
jgi:methylenetetrahydrofolate dehydrogenase (NADP+) / methenyltetrahydrofolate cyclohydrolase